MAKIGTFSDVIGGVHVQASGLIVPCLAWEMQGEKHMEHMFHGIVIIILCFYGLNTV